MKCKKNPATEASAKVLLEKYIYNLQACMLFWRMNK